MARRDDSTFAKPFGATPGAPGGGIVIGNLIYRITADGSTVAAGAQEAIFIVNNMSARVREALNLTPTLDTGPIIQEIAQVEAAAVRAGASIKSAFRFDEAAGSFRNIQTGQFAAPQQALTLGSNIGAFREQLQGIKQEMLRAEEVSAVVLKPPDDVALLQAINTISVKFRAAQEEWARTLPLRPPDITGIEASIAKANALIGSYQANAAKFATGDQSALFTPAATARFGQASAALRAGGQAQVAAAIGLPRINDAEIAAGMRQVEQTVAQFHTPIQRLLDFVPGADNTAFFAQLRSAEVAAQEASINIQRSFAASANSATPLLSRQRAISESTLGAGDSLDPRAALPFISPLSSESDAKFQKSFDAIRQGARESQAEIEKIGKAGAASAGVLEKSFANTSAALNASGKGFGGSYITGFAGMIAGAIAFQEVVKGITAIVETGQESQRVIFGLGKEFRAQTPAAIAFAQAASVPLGKTVLEIEKAELELQRMGKLIGLSQSQIEHLITLAADLSALSGKTLEQTTHSIGLAFVGQPRSLEILGVPLTNKALQSFADLDEASTKNISKLGLQERAIVAYNTLLKITTFLQGAAAERVESTAGAFDRLHQASGNLALSLGVALTPAINAAADGLARAAQSASDLLTILTVLDQRKDATSDPDGTRAALVGAINRLPNPAVTPPPQPPTNVLGIPIQIVNPTLDPNAGGGSRPLATMQSVLELQNRANAGDKAAILLIQQANAELEKEKAIREGIVKAATPPDEDRLVRQAQRDADQAKANRVLAEQAAQQFTTFRGGTSTVEDLTKPQKFDLGPERDPKVMAEGVAIAEKEIADQAKARFELELATDKLLGEQIDKLGAQGDTFKRLAENRKTSADEITKENQAISESIRASLVAVKPVERETLARALAPTLPLAPGIAADIARDPVQQAKDGITAIEDLHKAATDAFIAGFEAVGKQGKAVTAMIRSALESAKSLDRAELAKQLEAIFPTAPQILKEVEADPVVKAKEQINDIEDARKSAAAAVTLRETEHERDLRRGEDLVVSAIKDREKADLEAISKAEEAERRRHDTAVAAINDERDAKLKILDDELKGIDAAAQARSRTREDTSEQKSLAEAQRRLLEAKSVTPAGPFGQLSVDQLRAIRDAQKALDAARDAIGETRLSRGEDDARARNRAEQERIRKQAEQDAKAENQKDKDALDRLKDAATSLRDTALLRTTAAEKEIAAAREQRETIKEWKALKLPPPDGGVSRPVAPDASAQAAANAAAPTPVAAVTPPARPPIDPNDPRLGEKDGFGWITAPARPAVVTPPDASLGLPSGAKADTTTQPPPAEAPPPVEPPKSPAPVGPFDPGGFAGRPGVPQPVVIVGPFDPGGLSQGINVMRLFVETDAAWKRQRDAASAWHPPPVVSSPQLPSIPPTPLPPMPPVPTIGAGGVVGGTGGYHFDFRGASFSGGASADLVRQALMDATKNGIPIGL